MAVQKKQKPIEKDAQRQREDEILKRMLETPPQPKKRKKDKPKKD
ncbi:MAG: hypothetical protein O7B98_14060 [Alphaproteobacteria bacterium]|nr:hypothetical protein [Alphaproteobacteria bacterium]